ncbi:hypothetical protein DAEQUDRAFT_761997 [Daedalea quercina L-15889]|uniref:Uncharacterized protein n=1 Tax=Daedalea quercina L-15889 TaxID=1314783 RepID=A0A165TJJ0_9APHY|nr:hypothetical protein DAEQUDRAFT_761997 [Daedalea quercina L-15889]
MAPPTSKGSADPIPPHLRVQQAATTPRVDSSTVRAAGNRTSEDRVARDPQTGAASLPNAGQSIIARRTISREGSAEKAAIPYVSSSEPQEIDDLYGGMFEPGERATPLPEGAVVRTASPSDHRDNPALKRAEQPHTQDRAPSLAVSLPSEHESLATTPRPSTPPSPTPDRFPSEMEIDIIRFRAIPGLWPRCQDELSWTSGDAAAAVAMNLNGMAEFLESAREALKEHVTEEVDENVYELEGAGSFWRPISESLGCIVAAWGYACPQGMSLIRERADEEYAEIRETWSRTHEREMRIEATREKAEKRAQNERLTLHNDIKGVTQLVEKMKSDHDVVAGLADQLVEKTNERVEKELSKVDLGLAGIRSTLKALSSRIDDIATRGIDAPTYAKATAASSAKGKEKEVRIDEPTKDPRKRPRAQTPAAEQKQGSEDKKDGPRDAKRPKDHATPDTATTNILDLSTVADWRQLRAASTLGELAPGIKLSDAVAIAKGLQAPAAGSVTASLWSGVIPLPSTGGSTVVVPDGKNKAAPQMGAFGPAPPPFDKAKQKPPVHIKQGNAGVHPRQIVVRSLSKSFVVACFTDNMMTAACTSILTTEVGSANRPSSTLLKKSEVDWWVTFVDRPNDGEFEALKKRLPEVIEERCGIPAADILVEHMWTLTKMAIRNVPMSWKDPAGRKQIRDIGSLWHELQKNARTDKATAAFLDACIPFGNAPRATIDERAGTGQILCAVRDFNSGATARRLEKTNILMYGKACSVVILQARNSQAACRQCWRWGHSAARCNQPAAHCGRCGEEHSEEFHNEHALCCEGARIASGGAAPAVCPEAHDYCPNCKVSGHGPASQTSCKFWKHNQEKEWLARHAKEAESVDSQKSRTARERKKLRVQFKKEADETRAAKERELGAEVSAALAELRGLDVEDPMQQDHA